MQVYAEVFDELRQQFLDRAAGDTLVVVHRIWKGVENLGNGFLTRLITPILMHIM